MKLRCPGGSHNLKLEINEAAITSALAVPTVATNAVAGAGSACAEKTRTEILRERMGDEPATEVEMHMLDDAKKIIVASPADLMRLKTGASFFAWVEASYPDTGIASTATPGRRSPGGTPPVAVTAPASSGSVTEPSDADDPAPSL